MKSMDFHMPKDLEYHFDEGVNLFHTNRVIILDVNAMGLLRDELVNELGFHNARRFLLRFGFQHGYADFIQMKIHYTFDSELDLLASGPVIHTWEGLVHAAPTEIRLNRNTGEFFFTGIWTNSYEAQQHLSYHAPGTEPVCWTLMGYASGWCTAFFGRPLLAIEPVCMGMGHSHCEWLIQSPEAHGLKAQVYVDALKGLI
jgi:hypothetical protein